MMQIKCPNFFLEMMLGKKSRKLMLQREWGKSCRDMNTSHLYMAKVKAFDKSTIRSSLEENPRVTKVLIPSLFVQTRSKQQWSFFRERPGQETTSKSTEKVVDSTQPTVIECAHLDHPVSTLDSVKKCTFLDSVQNTPKNFHAGKICFHFDRWKELISDRYILKTVLGYKLDLLQCPMQAKLPPQIRFSPEEVTVVDTEIQKLLDKNQIW